MPTPGPVAYQVQSAFFTSFVISAGFDHVAPSSVLFDTHTVREPADLPSTMRDCESVPRLCVISKQMVPSSRSTTGQGLPQVWSSSVHTTCVFCHVLPPSRLRRSSRSIGPASPPPLR